MVGLDFSSAGDLGDLYIIVKIFLLGKFLLRFPSFIRLLPCWEKFLAKKS